MLHALLIDDEASARADLREKLLAHRNVAVVGEAATLSAARALLASADYQVVFLDVQLIGGISFDLVPYVRPGASIVFATAHAEYAARAFENHAVDYLLKPVVPGRLADAIGRVQALKSPGQLEPTLAVPSPPAPPAVALEKSARATEIPLTRDEGLFLRLMLEAWEDSLRSTHPVRSQLSGARSVRYERNDHRPRLWVEGDRISVAQRCWLALRARFTA